MAIKNTRQSIHTNPSEDRLKNKLKEGYSRFLKEAEEDEMDLEDDSMGAEDADLDMDLDGMDSSMEDDDLADAELDTTGDEMGNDLDGLAAIQNLEDTEKAQVDDWISTILSDSLDAETIDSDQTLDAEASADSLDPMGEEQYINDEVPMTAEELENIIASDDSLSALEATLAAMAQEQDTEGLDMEDDMEDDMDLSDDEELEESHDPMTAISKYFDKGFEGENTKDELMEDVELAPSSKEEGFEKVSHGLNDEITSTVKSTTGAGEPVDGVSIIKESQKRAKMLVKASSIIAKQNTILENFKKQVEALKLENYKLIKANGLLSVGGDKLPTEARNQISEAFDRCSSVEQVNKFYNKLTEKLKSANRPSLNETVKGNKNKITVLKESNSKEETVSREQLRKNMLMGIPTEQDVYFQ